MPRSRPPVYEPWRPWDPEGGEPQFEGSLLTKGKPGPPLPEEARAQNTACTCPWCL